MVTKLKNDAGGVEQRYVELRFDAIYEAIRQRVQMLCRARTEVKGLKACEKEFGVTPCGLSKDPTCFVMVDSGSNALRNGKSSMTLSDKLTDAYIA